jgi:hypothetical protein
VALDGDDYLIGVFPISSKHLICYDCCGQRRILSVLPVSSQKGLEIGRGNPHQPIEPVRDQKALIDPAPNGASADANALGDLFDREELLWKL